MRFLGYLALVWALAGCSLGAACENTVLETHPSADGAVQAVVFSRACGATTGFSTQVSLLEAGETLPDDGGNVFVADTDHGAAPAAVHGGPAVALRWTGPRQLEIAHHPETRLLKSRPSWRNVRVRYVPAEL